MLLRVVENQIQVSLSSSVYLRAACCFSPVRVEDTARNPNSPFLSFAQPLDLKPRSSRCSRAPAVTLLRHLQHPH